MLPKKGDLHDLNNWRGIMLLDAGSKILSMIITARLDKIMKEEGMEEQCGFTGGRGTSDGSFFSSAGTQTEEGARFGVVGFICGSR